MTISKEQNPEINQIQPIIQLLNEGAPEKALESVESLIKEFPNSSLLFNIRGACCKAVNKLDKALESFQKAVNIRPDFSEAYYNLGVIEKQLGQVKASITSYKKAIEIKPAYPDAHNNLGNSLLHLHQFEESINHFEWAVAFKPDFFEAYNNLGLAQRELDQISKSLDSFKKAIDLKPNYTQAYINLGRTLKDLGRTTDAIKYYKKLIEIQPNFDQGHLSIGIAYKELGLIDDAIKSLELAIKANPDLAVAYFNLGSLSQYTFSKAQLTKMNTLLNNESLKKTDRINLCFTLAQVNEDLGKKDDFFKFLHEGNRLRKEDLNYSIDNAIQNYNTIRKIFKSTSILKDKINTIKPSSKKPIFIIGMPRSGSTLVEQILSSHKNVYGAGELQVLRKILNPILLDYSNKDTSAASTKIGNSTLNLSTSNNISRETLESISEQYLQTISSFEFKEKKFTDKSLMNFYFIGFIQIAFPGAKIIHLKRDARAICWSIYKNNLPQKGIGFANDMGDLAKFYGLYTKLLSFWHELFPGKIYDLVYENLTTNQEEETKKLLEYCELDWDKNCLNFHKSKREVKTASVMQVRKKMYQGSSEAWKDYEDYLKPLLKSLSSF
jgi:tetratricopeptide (TPR) repeat protein